MNLQKHLESAIATYIKNRNDAFRTTPTSAELSLFEYAFTQGFTLAINEQKQIITDFQNRYNAALDQINNTLDNK